MYLVSQLWWFLLLAFLLGALLGYLLWRACGRRRIEAHYVRSNKELVTRLGSIEQERSSFSSAAVGAEGENAKLKAEIAGLQGKLAETSNRLNATVDAAETKLKSFADGVRSREVGLSDEIGELKKEAAEARKAWDAERATAKSREDKLTLELAQIKKAAGDGERSLNDQIKAAEKRARDDAENKHAASLAAAQEKVRSELTALHAAELKTAREQAKQHETKVLTLTQAGAGARRELEDTKARHAAEVKKARDDAAAEAAKKHAEDLKQARDQAKTELAAAHAAELKKACEDATMAAKRGHEDELARLKREAAALVANVSAPATVTAPAAPIAAAAPSAAPQNAPHGKAPGAMGAARGGKADDLKLIWGVGPEIEKLLNQNGIYHFSQIAAWTKSDISWFETFGKAFEGRIEHEKWVEQSKKLATGWRPDSETGEKPAGLSVLKGPRGGKADDLKLIWGVGPKLEKMLNGAGFYHFDQIAKWGPADINWVDSQLGEFSGRAVRDKWVEQCKKLATGWRPESDVGDKPV